MRGNVAGGGNFVGAGGVGGQHAALVPHQLLGGQPTHALHKTAFNLADVDGGVDGPANILKDVHPKHAGLTRQRVNRHFGASRAIGKVVKRPPGEGGFVVMNLGDAVKAIAPQLDAVGIGELDHIVEGARAAGRGDLAAGKLHGIDVDAIQPGYKLGQVAAHLAGGKLGGAGVQVRAGRRGRGRRIGHLAGVAGGRQYGVVRNTQLVRHDLVDLGVQPLAHFSAAVVDLHRAVQVDMHQRPGLVEQCGRERDAKLHRCDGQPALDDRAAAVPHRNGGLSALVLRGVL